MEKNLSEVEVNALMKEYFVLTQVVKFSSERLAQLEMLLGPLCSNDIKKELKPREKTFPERPD